MLLNVVIAYPPVTDNMWYSHTIDYRTKGPKSLTE